MMFSARYQGITKILLTEPIAKPAYSVTPAKAGVQNALKRLDSDFRRNDAEGLLQLA
jgi:tyrosine-protein phosphatase YwqE